jgi:hypothetical protein
MHYELWEFRSGSLVGTYDDEAEALQLVRRLLNDGWAPDDLALGIEDESVDVENLAPALTGSALAARAASTETPPSQRSA